ncbi:MAG TPA: ATP-binding protein, partial [Thermoanaerobaculia bacterium]|nr:ATP-binding protein [Thermoanaerobaculia bacterium]
GALIVGISPRRELDADYQGFLELVAGQIATSLANTRAYEEERRRAEALAELNRAKTAFFSNVSHEFRTPLTLLLGPLEELLAGGRPGLPDPLPDQLREPLLVAQRNARRLLRLVNSLLDFSRLEAGRARAAFQETDLAALTADLASVFRSATERVGLALEVDCPLLPEPVWVDREMWEKIVLNLLSNALKFTFEGKIEVTLRAAGGNAELAVRDTGTGMPPAELPHVFERFHRIEGARGRTHEGTGIGLALVQELVRLHGGTVTVETALGRGSTFTVAVPLGRAHLPGNLGADLLPAAPLAPLPAEQDVAARARAFLEELPDPAGLAGPAFDTAAGRQGEAEGAGGRILLADDNADMREYVRRLLAPVYQVQAAADGRAALAAARSQPPDLVLADVMMPGLDGFGLLRELRADPLTARIPVVLLSARAGEEARIEGLEAGADDYLVKPFSARELLARIRSHFDLARLREQAAERERELLAETRAALQAAREAGRAKDKFLAALSHELRTPLTPVVAAVSRLERDPRFDGARRELAMIRRNVELEARLIDDLLDLTRVARGKFELHREVIDLRRVVQQAIEICCGPEVLAGSRRLLVDIALADGTDSAGRVWGDASRLTQVFWNLLSNAVKFTPPGGVVGLRLEESGANVVVTVEDSGEGIGEEFLPVVFERFRQAANDVRGRTGLGLGLAIAKELVEMHGGSIAASSAGAG